MDEVVFATGSATLKSLFPKIDDRDTVSIKLTSSTAAAVVWQVDVSGILRSQVDVAPLIPHPPHPITVADSAMHLAFCVDGLAGTLDSRQLNGKSSLSLGYCAMFFNNFFQKPFLSADKFLLTRTFRESSYASSNSAANQLLIQDVFCTADKTILGFSPSMNLGNTLVVLNDQVAALSKALANKREHLGRESRLSGVPGVTSSKSQDNLTSPMHHSVSGSLSEEVLDGLAHMSPLHHLDSIDTAAPPDLRSIPVMGEEANGLPIENDSFSTFSLESKTLIMAIDVIYEDNYQTDFCMMEFEEFLWKLDSTKPKSFIRDDLRALDPYFERERTLDRDTNDLLTYLHHTDIMGGVLTFQAESFAMKLIDGSGEETVFLAMTDCGYFGPVYSSSVDYPLKEFQHSVVWIADNSYQTDFLHGHSKFEPSKTHFMTLLTKPVAGSKIYTDMTFAGESLTISHRQIDDALIAAVNATILDCTPKFSTAPRPTILTVTESPPPVYSLGPPLTTLNSMRYSYHGKFSMGYDKISVILHGGYLIEQIKMHVDFDHPRFFYCSSTTEFCSSTFSIDLERMTAMPMEARIQQQKRRTAFSSGYSSKASQRRRILTLPALVVSYTRVQDRVGKNFLADYGHHDVYVRPAYISMTDAVAATFSPSFNYLSQKYVLPPAQQYIGDDPFYFYRDRPMTNKWNIEIRLADNNDQPIFLDLRLDILVRINALLSSDNLKEKEGKDADKTLVRHTSVSSAPAVNNTNETSEIEAANKIDLQIIINKIVLYSAINQHNLNGIAFIVDNFDLQMRFQRKLPVSTDIAVGGNAILDDADDSVLYPLVIDHLFVDIQHPTIYMRDWCMNKNLNGRYGNPVPPSASSPKSRESSPMGGARRRRPLNQSSAGAEPRTLSDIMSIVKPIDMFSDAGKVEVSLTESGSVSSRNHTFHQSGKLIKWFDHTLLPSKKPLPATFFGIEGAFESSLPVFILKRIAFAASSNSDEDEISSRSDQDQLQGETAKPVHFFAIGKHWEKVKALLEAGIASTRRTHRQQFADGKRASQRVKKSHATALKARLAMQKSVLQQSSRRLEHGVSLRTMTTDSTDSDLFQEETANPYGNKMWGLRVVDSRKLFTIKIRDILFVYVARCIDLFVERSSKEDEKIIPDKKSKVNKSSSIVEVGPVKDLGSLSTQSELLTLLEDRSKGTTSSPPTYHSRLSPFSVSSTLNSPAAGSLAQQQRFLQAKSTDSSNLGREAAAGEKKEIQYFKVEFINTQVNFLDVKTHSSVIIAAGRAAVEGHRWNTATVSPMKTDGMTLPSSKGGKVSELFNPPMKRQQILLNMDGVSAFTVLTFPVNGSNNFNPSSPKYDSSSANSNVEADMEEDADIVHWKPRSGGAGGDGKKSELLAEGAGGAESELPYIKTAILDFKIQAEYIFWTEVSDEELKEIPITESNKELVCSFELNLPYIAVDVVSWQFYVIMNVIRNVLLVPPPTNVSKKQKVASNQTAEDDNVESKFLELQRDQELLEKNNFKARTDIPLDVNSKHHREELKILIEECLRGNNLEVHVGTARLVKFTIGKCVWILRSKASAVSENVLMETRFTGLYATVYFGEDR